jgi:glycosyltransferase involved in cell wall biosynthesis
MIKVAFLVPDNRQEFQQWELPGPVFGPAPQALLDGFAQISGCEVHVIFCLKRPLPVPEKIAPNVYAHGLQVGPAGYMKSLYFGCLKAIRKEVRRLGIDIVHGQGSERFPAFCAAKSGLPNVITLHGNMRELAKLNRVRPFSFHWIAARFEEYSVRRSMGVVCITSYTKRLVQETARKTWVVPNAVDESFFTVSRRPAFPPEIVCAAHVMPRKNQVALIRALEPLSKEFPFKLRLFGKVGDDAYSRELLSLAEEKPWCEGPREVPHAVLREELRGASLLILPSLEDNCPMAVLEAMAAGLPVAAAAVGGIPEIIENFKTGWLFDPHDPESIRSAVRQFLGESTLGQNIAAEARLFAEKRFRPKAVAKSHLEIYREVLQKD